MGVSHFDLNNRVIAVGMVQEQAWWGSECRSATESRGVVYGKWGNAGVEWWSVLRCSDCVGLWMGAFRDVSEDQ